MSDKYSTADLSVAAQNSDDLRRFGFYVGSKDNLSLIKVWATSQKHAIERFRNMCPDTVFITEAEMARRLMQRNNTAPEAAVAA
jgi:hypothetical protein